MLRNRKKTKKYEGFTMIELMVAVSVVTFLASIVLIFVRHAQAGARDARRVADMEVIKKALTAYYIDHGTFPANNPNSQDPTPNNWNLSYNAEFLQALVPQYIDKLPADPVNKKGAEWTLFGPAPGSYYYAYYFYEPERNLEYGCTFTHQFVIVGIRYLETGKKVDTPFASCGTIPPGGCGTGIIFNTCRDWSAEFHYSFMLIKD